MGQLRPRHVSVLIAVAGVVLASCATSTVTSPPVRVVDEPVQLTPVPEPVPVDSVSPEAMLVEPAATTIPSSSEPSRPATVAEPVSVASDAAIIATGPEPVAPADPPVEAVGTDDGPATQRAQERLLELGFWLSDATGDYGLTTRQAVMAFQKYHGLETDGVLGPLTAAALTSVTELPAARADAGTLVEVDKGLQLVFIVLDGSTEWILNASTGSEIPYREPDQNTPGAFQEGDSVTRPGLFEVNRERPEGWWEGDLGEIYRPKYFDGGIALHGSNSVPDYPASHGCVRVSVAAMDWIWETGIVPMATPVWVHGEIPGSDQGG